MGSVVGKASPEEQLWMLCRNSSERHLEGKVAVKKMEKLLKKLNANGKCNINIHGGAGRKENDPLYPKGTNRKMRDSWTSLHWAAEQGFDRGVSVLLKNGANVDERTLPLEAVENENETKPESSSDGGWTPVFLAAGRGQMSTVNLLIENGANLLDTCNGMTILEYVEQNRENNSDSVIQEIQYKLLQAYMKSSVPDHDY
eukprot:g6482.t1